MIPFNARARKVAPLLFGSGLCALIYQVVWTREFRLVFGASTAASAAVLAIFVGGLGAGGLVLGKRADRNPRPLAFYAQLETLIAISAGLTPLLLGLVRWAYIQVGGSTVLGLAVGTVVRLLLAGLVLAVPTFLMGGTLPAAARAAETEDDAGRRSVALLYGVNTLGAVTGSLLATFLILEVFGNQTTLWIAALVNLLVAVMARRMARLPDFASSSEPSPSQPISAPDAASIGRAAPVSFVLTAALCAGFAFFLMELVWYRMLGPLLGGTVFTFGLILAVALLGIGVGGLSYSIFGRTRPATLNGFAYTCLLEAAFIALPFALGDRIAVLAVLLRPLGNIGFTGHLIAWSSLTACVILPAAIASGIQFPLLIALMGQARRDVGKEIGLVYAWNTAGAIGGALAGGFGLLPMLTAPGCWRLVILVLAVLALAAAGIAAQRERRWWRMLPQIAIVASVFAMSLSPGPTAAWRHSPIGAGRVDLQKVANGQGIHNWLNSQRGMVRWEAEGVESSVALIAVDGFTFVVNGKSDGNTRKDAATTVMGGLLGALTHPRPTSAMVIGLGTGSTAGWLGAVPSIERVDAVELEPAMLEVARRCSPVNAQALENPKVHVTLGDAREVLLTTRQRYDLIFSEPSNPYRAGVASLFTREFYQGAAARLNEGGIFMQWVQGYEVDGRTLRSVYATLGSVFPEVETWQLASGDLLLMASQKAVGHNAVKLRQRIVEEPFKTALASTWRVNDLEGLLAHYLAGPDLARTVAAKDAESVSTDDRNHIEFGFARDVGKRAHFDIGGLEQTARELHSDRMAFESGEVDQSRLEERRVDMYAPDAPFLKPPPHLSPEQKSRIKALTEFTKGNSEKALAAWRAQAREPQALNELAMMAVALADAGDSKASVYIDRLREYQPVEADAVLAQLYFRQKRIPEAAAALKASFVGFQRNPWPSTHVMIDALSLVRPIAEADKKLGLDLFKVLLTPFAVDGMEVQRIYALVNVSRRLDFTATCAAALAELEPNVPWDGEMLRMRRDCYQSIHHPLLARASEDLGEFLEAEPAAFGAGLTEPRMAARSAEAAPETIEPITAASSSSAAP